MNRDSKFFLALCLFVLPVFLAACASAARVPRFTETSAPVPGLNTSAAAEKITAAVTEMPATITLTPADQTRKPALMPSSTLAPSRTPIPSFTPIATATFVPTGTRTPVAPGPTITPTATKYPPLAASQPFLVYFSNTSGAPGMTLVNADASGLSTVPLPKGSRQPWLPDSLSPDGQWLAFHTGTAGTGTVVPEGSGKFDLTLNLLHLPDGKVQPVIPLLSARYPQDLKDLAAKVTSNKNGVTISEESVFKLFRSGITALQWSPDSKSLAFAGQMDGPASEVYLYDLASGKMRALTSGSTEQIWWLFWSPDGRYLVVVRGNGQCSEDCTTRWVIDVVKGEAKQLPQLMANGAAQIYDWASPTALTYYGMGNGYQGFLQTVDITTGQVTSLYQNVFTAFALDPEQQLLAFTRSYDAEKRQPVEQGIYMDWLDQGEVKLVASFSKYGNLNVRFWGHPTSRFIAWTENKIYALTADGELLPLADGKFLGISPDHQKLLALKGSGERATLLLLDASGKTIKELPAREELIGTNSSLIFSPNSDGVFLASPQGLYYLGWAMGKWVLVDPALPMQNWTWPGTLPYGWKK